MDYAKARQSMVDSQIHPMGVVSDKILYAFETVPRENYVPEKYKDICYLDEDIKVTDQCYLMEPSVFGRLIEAGDIQEDDAVLTIGSGIGYNAAILSHLCETVVALEENEDLTKIAQEGWDQCGFSNIAAISGALKEGAAKFAPYDVILFNGAIPAVPEQITRQLKMDGKLLAIIRNSAQELAKATLFIKTGEDQLSGRVLFDAGTPYLKGFTPEKTFVF